MKMSPNMLALVTDKRGTRFGETSYKEKARPKPGLDRMAQRKAPRPFLIAGPASLITPSWNQVVGFLTDWDELRRLAA
jgi:hypothetical protein